MSKRLDTLGDPRDNSKDPTPYAVICPTYDDEPEGCGLKFLSKAQYEAQLMRPNATWRCPGCGREAHWDDFCQITNPAEEPEDMDA